MAKYTLKKGKHYNTSKIRFIISLLLGLLNAETIRRWFLIHLSKYMIRYVIFSKECWYSKDSIEKTGWNKLFGFSGWLIHQFSGRLVWQPEFTKPGWIDVCLYVYNKGKWSVYPIEEVQVKTIHKMSVVANNNYYTGSVNGISVNLEAEKTPHFIVAEPYFGGESTAPHDMNIYLYNPLTYKLFKKWIIKKRC